jgi:hypothetical protein
VEIAFDGFVELTRSIEMNRRIVEVKSLVGALPEAEQEALKRFQIELIVPISNSEGQLIGILMLSKKISEDFYTPENLDIMASIASHALAESSGIGRKGQDTAERKDENIIVFRSAKAKSLSPRTRTVFISYARDDVKGRNWLEELETHFTPLRNRRNGDLRLWYDRLIVPGKDWWAEIGSGIKNADAAILLIGPGFLGSPFIMKTELPVIWDAEKRYGLRVYPLLISFCDYKRDLGQIQFVNPTDEPLNMLPEGEQDRVLTGLVEAIEAVIKENETKANVP